MRDVDNMTNEVIIIDKPGVYHLTYDDTIPVQTIHTEDPDNPSGDWEEVPLKAKVSVKEAKKWVASKGIV
jgi:hypothetical protein